jgi:predicted outer membrane repeat protein
LISGENHHIDETIIDGDSADSVIELHDYEDSTTAICGFTIQNGFDSDAGGIRIYYSSPKIVSNIIKRNFGVGVFCYEAPAAIINNTILENTNCGIYSGNYSDGIIKGNIIRGNSANYGAGIFCAYSSPKIINNVIENNSSRFDGGAVVLSAFYADFCHNIINSNHAKYGGALACEWGTDGIISNNIITNNRADSTGGAIFCNQDGSPTFENNIIISNWALSHGAIYCIWNSHPVILNSIIWDNSNTFGPTIGFNTLSSAIINFSDIQDTLWPGMGNISVIPQLRDTTNSDYRLMALACGDSVDSPCIDAGHPDSLDGEMGCHAGLGTGRADMGAYGGGGNITGIEDEGEVIPSMPMLLSSYPNPFNAQTTIRFSLPQAGPVEIDIYDILGRRIGTLYFGELLAGEHGVVWDAGENPSGIYFYRLKAKEGAISGKMTLVK